MLCHPKKKRHGSHKQVRKVTKLSNRNFSHAHPSAEDLSSKKRNKSKRPPLTHEQVCKTLQSFNFDMLGLDQKKFYRHHVREFLGTQQPTFTLRTSFTTLTTSGTNLTQVIAMDVTGISPWSSLANLFDEYRVMKAKLHIVPLYQSYGASATALAAMPVITVIDYDDSTALGSLAAAVQYDTMKIIHLGGSNSKVHSAKEAHPEGIPDLTWVTTATPTVPFWWKFWSLTTLVPTSAAVGYAFIEAEVEFRQVA